MAMQGSIVPRQYYDVNTAAPYPSNAISGLQGEVGELFTCSATGRTWIISDLSPLWIPLALQYQTTSAGAGTTTANIRRVNSGSAGNVVAGFEHTGAVQLTDLPSAPMLGTNANGRIVSVSTAPAASTSNSVRILARNNTGAQISKGAAVRISGALGQNPTIALAQANAYATTDAIGLSSETIANNATGYVIIAGTLTDLDTQAFTDGAALYLSAATPGGLTATEPVKPNWQMQIGTVEHAHPTQGKILVHPNLESVKTDYISDMTSAGETLATLAPMTESTLLGRGSGLGSGNPEVITLGYGKSLTGTGTTLSTALSHASSFIGADVSLVNATQFYNITTLSLAAGVWVVQASAVFTSTAAGTTQYTLDIYNSTSATSLACSAASHGAAANLFTNASCCVVISLASTSTIAMRGAASVASRTVKYQSNVGGLSNATGLVAMRIG